MDCRCFLLIISVVLFNLIHEIETARKIPPSHSHGRYGGRGRPDRPGRPGRPGGRDRDRTDSGSERYTLNEVEEPFSGQRVRLRGNNSEYNSGLVEVFRKGDWGIICDDHWTQANADVVCRQLGFSLGAIAGLPNAAFGTGLWEDNDILMDEVSCDGTENKIQRCVYVNEHDCNVLEAASVVCHTTPDCPDGWYGGLSSCYKLVTSQSVRTRRDADRYCTGEDGFLAVVETREENNYLSDLLMYHNPDIHSWLVGGKRHHGNWVWIYVDKQVTLRTADYGGDYLGGNVIETTTIVREHRTMNFTKWFPGWVPTGYSGEPSYDRAEFCIGLVNQYELPNGTMGNVNYYFWDDILCRNRSGLNFVCERKTLMPAEPQTDGVDCYNGNGADYNGTASVTVHGSECLPWTLSTITNPDTSPNAGLGDHSYCRNPDDDEKPWCWVDVYKNVFGYCDLPECGEVPATPPPVATTTTEEIEELDCPQGQFYCGQSSRCISNQWRCDGEADCEYEEDEEGCSYFLDNYEKYPNMAMMAHALERYSAVPLEMCARLCMENQGYVCRSFSYNTWNRSCFFSEVNIQMVGMPQLSDVFDFYELTSQTLNCTDQFMCDNGKCMDRSLLCNMVDDCGDFSDENEHFCGSSPPIEIRLAGGTEYSGRVEIKYRGEWGIICDDSWDINDAWVVCRSLGFSGVIEAPTRAEFGEGNGNILLDEVQCLGNESSLEDCPKSAWKEHDCRPYEAAGVICSTNNTKACAIDEFMCTETGQCIGAVYVCNGNSDCGASSDEQDCDVRVELVDGDSERNGRVEITRNGLRGTVCDDDWDDVDAGVVCKMLGFLQGGIAHAGTVAGAGSGLIWTDDVTCAGDEDFLYECLHSQWGIHNCEHQEDAWLTCRTEADEVPTEDTDVTIELVGGFSPQEGRVEIVRHGIRGTVCDDRWDNDDATVVCRMLGYREGIAMSKDEFGPGSETMPIFLDEVACVGNELSITNCGEINWGSNDCTHDEDAGVRCAFPEGGDSGDGGSTGPMLPTDCGRMPLLDFGEEAPLRRKRDEWEEKELDEKPRFEKVIGGQTAEYGHFPWQAGIRRVYISDGEEYVSHWCGGTILSEYWILSAAHCYESLQKSNFRIRTGDLDNKNEDDYEQEFEVEQLLMHELYDDNAYDFDIALIKIQPKDGHGIRFNDYVQPACLPEPTTLYEAGTDCVISGWGKTEYGYPNLLVEAKVPIIAHDECQILYKGEITSRMFCAGLVEGGIDTCSGDSGGPFVCRINGIHTVLGATSWGNGCAQPNSPGVYAHVQVFLPWIKDKIREYS